MTMTYGGLNMNERKAKSDSSTLRKITKRADLGGGGGGGQWADIPSLRDLTPRRPKGSHLCTILRYPFLGTDPKVF